MIHFDKTLLSSIKTAQVFCLPVLGPPTAAIETNGKIPIYFTGGEPGPWKPLYLRKNIFPPPHDHSSPGKPMEMFKKSGG